MEEIVSGIEVFRQSLKGSLGIDDIVLDGVLGVLREGFVL